MKCRKCGFVTDWIPFDNKNPFFQFECMYCKSTLGFKKIKNTGVKSLFGKED
jgi:hypothetical protein